MKQPTDDFLDEKPEGTLLRVRAHPRAKRDEIGEVLGGRLKIRLAAPPVDNKANQALCRFLADKLRTPQSRISVAAGSLSRDKSIMVAGLNKETVRSLLAG